MNDHPPELVDQDIRTILSTGASFADIVSRLAEIGIERYHVDYSREEGTYYRADGKSVVLTLPHPDQPIGGPFLAEEVEQSVRRSQRGEHTYEDFLRETRRSGCVGYFVQISGRRVQYFGRRGEVHEELFPAAK